MLCKIYVIMSKLSPLRWFSLFWTLILIFVLKKIILECNMYKLLAFNKTKYLLQISIKYIFSKFMFLINIFYIIVNIISFIFYIYINKITSICILWLVLPFYRTFLMFLSFNRFSSNYFYFTFKFSIQYLWYFFQNFGKIHHQYSISFQYFHLGGE